MKKVLSFVLVLTLVLGSFSMAFATDFTDQDKISQGEAVDVMTATGIITGYPDGSFGPQGDVTREQMAKMISVLMNGGEDVGSYYASASKFTDTQGWSAGYVAYCASKGIIAGRTSTTFDPLANVTATEAAKMLLVALGYNADYEGYVGTNWKVNILADAKKADLFDDTNIKDYDKNIDRETAAQMIFNAMNANTVDYDKESAIKIGDVEITQTSTAKDVTDKDGNKVALYKDKFEGDLVRTESTATTDDFNRPAHTWKYDGDKIGTYASDADYTFVAGDNYSGTKAVQKAIEDYDDDILAYEAGKCTTTLTDVSLNGSTFASVINTGDVVELYGDEDAYKVVIVRYSLDMISDVDTDVDEDDADDGVTCYVDLKGGLSGLKVTGDSDTEFEGFNASTYVEDAFVAVVVKGDEVIASYIPETKEGEITDWSSEDVVVDGTTYDAVTGYKVVKDDYSDTSFAKGDSYTVYVGTNGYALGAVLVEATDNDSYGVIVGIEENSTDKGSRDAGKASYTVKILSSDLKETSYDTKTYKYNVTNNTTTETTETQAKEAYIAFKAIANLYDAYKDTLVKYTLDSNGKLKTVELASSFDGSKSVTDKAKLANKYLDKDVVAFYYDNDDEEYVTYDYNDLLKSDVDSGTQYILKDSKYTYLLLANDVNGSDDILGYYVDSTQRGSGDDAYYKVTLMVNGEKKVYNTDSDKAVSVAGLDAFSLVKVALNGDDEIVSITAPTLYYAKEGVDKFGKDAENVDINGLVYNATSTVKVTDIASGFAMVTEYKDNAVTIGGDNVDISGARVYRLTTEDGDNDAKKLVLKTSGSIKGDALNGDYVVLLQLDEDSDDWDTVVFIKNADKIAVDLLLEGN
jgi:uncharacterized protein Veg